MFRPDDKIGPYTLIRTIGRGAFGETWLAEKRSALLTTKAALKIPLVAENDVEIVRQEAALWLRASGHPNIVPVLDADIYDGQVVIASEFIAGGSLHEWMEANFNRTSSLEEAVSFTNGILAGLDYLHRVGLTHRDLKPENVLLQDGIPRLADFGLARVLKTEAQTGTISGTPRYMAPETFSGSYSAASDLWAVGVMLYELLTGGHPFPTQELMALIVAIQSQEPAPLPESIPERLRGIVTRLLAKSPSDRLATASAVREAIQHTLQPVVSSLVAQASELALPSHNLPVQPTSFIGREKEITELKGLLEHTHLLTLTGSGGCGKTRLALQVAEAVLEQYPDGVWLVELASLTDPALVPQTVAQAIGAREVTGQTLTQTLTERLKTMQTLLVLDNCEHLVSASAALANTLIRTCPSVTLLASSREPLGIAGENTYRIPSLSLPARSEDSTPESLSQYEAVRLFVERAASVVPVFTITNTNAPAVAQICHCLDGIPLAIELAAARIRVLSVEQIAARLDDRFRLLTGGSRTALPRHQTLRALIDWSYSLLTGQEGLLLRRLSVFSGGWTVEATEAVCADEEIEAWEVLDLLTSLVDKSLVTAEERTGEARYGMLETVRQYGLERLEETGEATSVHARHLAFFVNFAKDRKTHSSSSSWLRRMVSEQDNLRAALVWSLTKEGNTEVGLQLAVALRDFWESRGYWKEGSEWLSAALAHTAGASAGARATALWSLSRLIFVGFSDPATAIGYAEEALVLSREAGDRRGIASALRMLAIVYRDNLGLDKARPLFEESLAIFREIGDSGDIGWTLHCLGMIAHYQGDYARARTLYEEALPLRRTWDDTHAAWTLLYMARLDCDTGDYAASRKLYQEVLVFSRADNNLMTGYTGLEFFAWLLSASGEPQRAARLLGAAKRLRLIMGREIAPADVSGHDNCVTATRTALGEEPFLAAFAEGEAWTMEQAIQYMLDEKEG